MFSGRYDPEHYQRVDLDGAGFYGGSYWLEHVPEKLGLPSLEERAESDLSERAVFLLKRVLEYLPPNGPLLELGCAPGGLSYLLSQAGFAAEGIEMSEICLQFMRERFNLEVHQGPLEDSGIDRSFKAVIAVDVLEHLPRPLGTVAACADRLEDDGLLLLQTPCYRDEGGEWEMLLPGEHLFLFDEDSVRALLQAGGFRTVECRKSLFSYDMWVAASRSDRIQRRPDPLEGTTPATRALIACYDGASDLQVRLVEVDGDRRAKDDVVERLSAELAEVDRDRGAKDDLIQRLNTELAEVEGDRRAKDEAIGRLSERLAAEDDAVVRLRKQIEELSAELEEVRQDQTAKSELIERISAELESARADQRNKEELIHRLSADLEEVREDQRGKEDVIQQLDSELGTLRADHLEREELVQRLEAEISELKGRWAYRVSAWTRSLVGGRRE